MIEGAHEYESKLRIFKEQAHRKVEGKDVIDQLTQAVAAVNPDMEVKQHYTQSGYILSLKVGDMRPLLILDKHDFNAQGKVHAYAYKKISQLVRFENVRVETVEDVSKVLQN